MKHPRPSTRRFLAIAAAALAGTAAALALASPASARADGAPSLSTSYDYDCQADGNWIVSWSVANNSDSAAAEITSVALTPAGTTVSNIAVGATIPALDDLDGVQIVPGSATGASIAVSAKWGEFTDDVTQSFDFEFDCEGAYTVAQECDDITFTFTPVPASKDPEVAGIKAAGSTALAFTYHVKLTPSTGSPVEFDVTSGDPDKVVTFPASPGLTVTVLITIFDFKFEKVEPWTHAPCPTPSPSPSLPVTGSSLGGAVGIGAGLVVLGAGLIAGLFLLRRRRTVAGG